MLLPAFEKWKGVEVEDKCKNDWALESIKYLNENPEEYLAYCMSGDTMVIALRLEGEGVIEVMDLRIRNRMILEDHLQKKE